MVYYYREGNSRELWIPQATNEISNIKYPFLQFVT